MLLKVLLFAPVAATCKWLSGFFFGMSQWCHYAEFRAVAVIAPEGERDKFRMMAASIRQFHVWSWKESK